MSDASNRRFDQEFARSSSLTHNRGSDQYSNVQSEKKPTGTWAWAGTLPTSIEYGSKSSPEPRVGPKVRQILKNLVSRSINTTGGRVESGGGSFRSVPSEKLAYNPIKRWWYAESARIRIKSIDHFNAPHAGSRNQRDHGTGFNSAAGHDRTGRRSFLLLQ